MRRLLLIMFLFTGQLVASGNIYSYVDEQGVTVFTNLGAKRPPQQKENRGNGLPGSGNFYPLIRDYSSQYGLNEDLVQAIIKVESNFDPSAVSEKDCKGLMQLHPDTAERFGVENVFDPAENIEGGVKFLSYLMDSFDNKLDHVLAAYNAGENAVKRYQGIPPYSETRQYVKKVKSHFKETEETRRETIRRKQRVVRTVDEDGFVVFSNVN